MEMFVIEGGHPLNGTVRVSGAKNATLPLMAAALCADGKTQLDNVPDLVDVSTLADLLSSLGTEVVRVGHRMTLTPVDPTQVVADYDLVRKMRASVCVLGPLLASRGLACVSLPGGCNIGSRPIDLHLKGLRALGAEIRVERGYVWARADQLQGTRIHLGGPHGSTVTGTCNVLSAAVRAKGKTIINSAACEPEVVDLGILLNRMGAKIRGLGTPRLEIDGVDRLNGCAHTVIPDRIEAATLMIAVGITGGDVEIQDVRFDHLHSVIEKLREVGLKIDIIDDRSVRVRRSKRLLGTDCTALPYPGIPTDLQAQFMTLLSLAEQSSVITDRVFPDRFMHAAELTRMGALIQREGPTAVIRGTQHLSGTSVMASDLRASAALVLAGLAAQGDTVVRRIYHLDRGYEHLERKLNGLGASIRRVSDVPENLPSSLQADRDTERLDRGAPVKRPKWLDRPLPEGPSPTLPTPGVSEQEASDF